MPPARCLDLTRLISRLGRGPHTGIDRVELAYLRALLADPVPLFLLVRTWLGYLLLDQAGAEAVLNWIEGRARWGKVDLLGQLQRKAHPMRRRAEADLRRLAVGRAPANRLARLVRRATPEGTCYVNVGHTNLTGETLAPWDRRAVMVHDMIPLDHPEFQRPGTVDVFEARMRSVARHADLVICNSAVTEGDVRRWFGNWGRVPETVVAHLGVDLAEAKSSTAGRNFLVLGTIEPRKNHALLLDVWEALAGELPMDKMPGLRIIGTRGWNNAAVFERLDKKPPFVDELGGLSDAALQQELAGAAALLFPSLAEGYGLPAVEALTLGKPVICSDLPVFREILGNSPIYAQPGDVYLWKQSILQIAGQNEADRTDKTSGNSGFRAPSWDAHFNHVLKRI